jgi:CRP/FNR family cyclic AMP-dependent transcriptional regulator
VILSMRVPSNLAEFDDARIAEDLGILASRGVQREHRKNTMLIHEGDEGDTLFVILSGRVKVYAVDANDREVTYGILGRGSYFGEMSLDGGPRSASVITLEPTVCSSVSKRALREFLVDRPEFAFHLLITVIERARQATRIARSLALDSVYSRLIRFLSNNAVAQADGTHALPERMTHQEMASRIGASREMVSRILKDLETGGYLSTHDHRVRILNKLPGQW